MKIVWLLVAVATAVIADVSDHIYVPTDLPPDYYENKEDVCKKKFNVTEEELKEFEKDKVDLPPAKMCYFKCVYNLQKTMDEQGVYNRTLIKELTGPYWPVAESCLGPPYVEVCKQAMDTYRCFVDNKLVATS